MNLKDKKTILLVEDNSTTAFVEKMILEKYGFNVICVNTGEAAIEIVANSPRLDIVLMDINLGEGMDGTDAAKIILKMRDLPLIFLSSHTEREIVERTEGITSYGYIVKDSGETVLIASIKMAFRLFNALKNEKEKEEALLAEEYFNKSLIQMSPAFIVALKSDGSILMMNESMLNALNYRADEVIGKDYIPLFVPEADRKTLLDTLKQIACEKQTIVSENRILRRDGCELTCEWRGIPVYRNEKLDFFLGIGIDVTERKRAEQEALKHKIFRNKIFENSTLPIVVMDVETSRFIDCNPAAVAVLGYTSIDEVLGKTPFDVSAPVQYDGTPSSKLINDFNKIGLNEGSVIFEWSHQRPNGELWDAEMHLLHLILDGKDYIQATILDITERKKAKKALAETEILHSSVIDSSSDFIWSVDIQRFELLSFNHSFSDYYSKIGVQLKKGMSLNELAPDEDHVEQWRGFFQNTLRDGVFTTEYKTIGNRILRLNFNLLKKGEDLLGISVFGKDITEQKQAEKEIKKARDFAENLIATANVIIVGLDNFGRVNIFNDTAENITGYTKQELKGKNWFEVLVPKEKFPDVWTEFNRIISGNLPKHFENPIITKTGEERYIIWQNNHLLEDGEIIGTISFGIDITDKKKYEHELKSSYEKLSRISRELEISENKYRQIFENIPVGIFQREAEGKFIFANPAMLEQFECGSLEEFLKNYSDLSKRWAEPEKHQEFMELLSKNNKVFGYEVKIRLINDKFKWLSLFAYLDKSNMHINGFSLDVTKRKQAEEELRHSEEKIKTSLLEKDALLRELYHRTKNNMQVICAMLAMHSYKTNNNELKVVFKDMETRIHSMALVHQKLYKSKDLSKIDLYEYVVELANLLMKSYNISSAQISLDIKVEKIPVLIDLAIPCGLLLNELFSNSLKYAFPDKRTGKISLSIENMENIININYSDDGTGLPENFDYRTDGKMGLQSVLSIVEDQLLGNISINSNKGFHCIMSFKNTIYEERI